MNKTIFDIVKEGTLEELIQAIKENVDVNEKNIYGSSLLHIACLNNELEKVKILFKAGADVYLEDKSRQSSFGIALKKKHFEIVKFFLKNGTHIDSTKPFNGFTSVFFAAFFEHDIEMCEELLKMGANPNIECFNGQLALTSVVDSHQPWAVEIIKLLLDYGADPYLKEGTDRPGVTSRGNAFEVARYKYKMFMEAESFRISDKERKKGLSHYQKVSHLLENHKSRKNQKVSHLLENHKSHKKGCLAFFYTL